MGDESSSVLDSLRFYDKLRLEATGSVTRPEGSNLDFFRGPNGQEMALCHLSSLLPFTTANYVPRQSSFEDVASTALAIQHLNTGDGSIVPEVQGLSDRCKIRFTAEFADTEYNAGVALSHLVDQTRREPGSAQRIPCAFIGAYRSSVSIPMSIVTGILGYPQISQGSTSPDLDDTSQFPLFGRTVPSDDGNAVPIIIYLREQLQIKHLAVINVNDAYGNAFVEAMRTAAAQYAPDMIIQQAPLDEEQSSIEVAVETVKRTNFRFVFALVFSQQTHDNLMMEAHRQGVAGTGVHTWMFGDSFRGTLEGRTIDKDSPLHLAYRGSGVIVVSGGVQGRADYDEYAREIAQLKNPTDLEYMASLIPKHNHSSYAPTVNDVPFVFEDTFLTPLTNGFTPFAYEATIALGLAACSAMDKSESFTGHDHFDEFKKTTFQGVSGSVAFDPVTGTRDPSSALFKVNNYVEQEVIDPETGDTVVQFAPTVTDLFINGEWDPQQDYVFNDGTTNLPIDIPPQVGKETVNTGLVVGLSLAAAFVIGCMAFLVYDRNRRESDSLWQIKKEDIKFEEVPEVIGTGSFGVVLLGKYRGTPVAVKRVLPRGKKGSPGNSFGMKSMALSKGHMSGYTSGIHGGPESSSRKKMRKEFTEEMRYLSKLRHPSIITLMGAVTGREPMLVMEYMKHGSLWDILHNETMPLEAFLIRQILLDICQGILFLHSADSPVIHGDLKAQNILIDSKFRAKVADFGLSKLARKKGGAGTPLWMAPELLRKESSNTCETDVYAFGIVLYEIYSRRDPYEGEDADEVLRFVADKNVRKRPPVPRGTPEPMKVLMTECLVDDAQKRPNFNEIDMRMQRIDAESGRTTSNNKASSLSLFDIFPRHIAEALRDGRTVEAEHRDMVTIFFSDIVGFTTISSELPPKKIADLLDRLYTKFDALSLKHDIFKLETIGDAYVAVANLVKDQPDDHAKRIAQFAIEAVQAANETVIDLDEQVTRFVDIRAGFHSGPIVADVVGTTNPRYCLFGDSMNTASRMESNSKANRIQCSKVSATLLEVQCPEMALRPRGKIAIKGKGRMHTFWVDEEGQGRRSSDIRLEEEGVRLSLDAKKELAKLEELIEDLSESTNQEEGDIESPPESAPTQLSPVLESSPKQPRKEQASPLSIPEAVPEILSGETPSATDEHHLEERLHTYLSQGTISRTVADMYFE